MNFVGNENAEDTVYQKEHELWTPGFTPLILACINAMI
jgi:hypothetical protein